MGCVLYSTVSIISSLSFAQMILNYYVEYLSGNVSGKVTDYGDFVSSHV